MAITILSQPDSYQPDYSIDGHQLSYVLDSTQSYLCSMKYIGDVYINGDYVTTIKNSPNLKDGKCVMTFNEVISDFISYDRWNGPNFQICTQSKCDYKIIFGEETDGTSDCSNGTFGIQYGPSHSGIAFNGTLQYAEKTFNQVEWGVGMSGSHANFLTNSPYVRDVNIQDHDYLYFISSIDTATSSVGASGSMHMEVSVTDDQGVTRYYYIPNRYYSEAGTIFGVGTGPRDLERYIEQGIIFNNNSLPVVDPIITCSTVTYSVTLGKFVGRD